MGLRIMLCLLFIVPALSSRARSATGEEAAKAAPAQGSALQKIRVLSNTKLKIPEECTHGFYLGKDLLAFGAPDGEARDSVILNKYIVCNRQGDVVKEYDKVLFWDGGELMLKVNALSTLLLINLATGDQQIIDIDYGAISAFSFNPFAKTFIYALGWQNQIWEYNYEARTNRVVAKLASGNFLLMSQVSPNEIVYARTKATAYFDNIYDDDPTISVQVPLFLINLKYYKEAELTKISRTGILLHFDQANQELLFVVEEKGFLKILRSGDLKSPKLIKISQLNQYSERWFEGIILHYSEMHPRSGLLACSRIRLNYKGDPKKNKFEIYSLGSENFDVAAGEIHLLDLNGNHRQLTDTPDRTEVVCDWGPDGDEILYFDHKNRHFYIMELDMKGEFDKKSLEIDEENAVHIRP